MLSVVYPYRPSNNVYTHYGILLSLSSCRHSASKLKLWLEGQNIIRKRKIAWTHATLRYLEPFETISASLDLESPTDFANSLCVTSRSW